MDASATCGVLDSFAPYFEKANVPGEKLPEPSPVIGLWQGAMPFASIVDADIPPCRELVFYVRVHKFFPVAFPLALHPILPPLSWGADDIPWPVSSRFKSDRFTL